MWADDNSFTDSDLLDGFAAWVKQYRCAGVVSASNPDVIRKLSSIDPGLIWMETLDGYLQLINTSVSHTINPDGTLNLKQTDVEEPQGFYVCEIAYQPGDPATLITGGQFLCEECESYENEGAIDCALCNGAGGFTGTIHDLETRDVLLVTLEDLDSKIPEGFVFAPQGAMRFEAPGSRFEGFDLD